MFRTNSLIVAATDALFNEVKKLVDEVDQAAASDNEEVRVVKLRNTSAAAVQRAMAAFAGDALQTSSTTTPGMGTQNRGGFNTAGTRGGGFNLGGGGFNNAGTRRRRLQSRRRCGFNPGGGGGFNPGGGGGFNPGGGGGRGAGGAGGGGRGGGGGGGGRGGGGGGVF